MLVSFVIQKHFTFMRSHESSCLFFFQYYVQKVFLFLFLFFFLKCQWVREYSAVSFLSGSVFLVPLWVLCRMIGVDLFWLFHMQSVWPAPFVEATVLFKVCVSTIFTKNWVSTEVWIYVCAFNFIIFANMSVLCQYHVVLKYYSSLVQLEISMSVDFDLSFSFFEELQCLYICNVDVKNYNVLFVDISFNE